MADPNIDIDLEVVKPKTLKVRIRETVYDLEPPSLEDFMILTSVAGKLENLDKLSKEDAAPTAESMNEVLSRVIPKLKDDNVVLTGSESLALFSKIAESITPPDSKKLKEMGITPNSAGSGEKKTSESSGS